MTSKKHVKPKIMRNKNLFSFNNPIINPKGFSI